MDKYQVKSIKTWNTYFNTKYSCIVKDFHSQSINLTCCPECEYTTSNMDPIMTINLDIDEDTDNIYDCLNNYTNEFIMDEENKWTCDKCGEKVQCKKEKINFGSYLILLLLISNNIMIMKINMINLLNILKF